MLPAGMIAADTVVGQCVVVVLCFSAHACSMFDDVSMSGPVRIGPEKGRFGQGCIFWVEFLRVS